MPQMGESIAEGTVSRWLKRVGDTVGRDEPLLEISTDKVDTEIPSPVSGVLLEILAGEDSRQERHRDQRKGVRENGRKQIEKRRFHVSVLQISLPFSRSSPI